VTRSCFGSRNSSSSKASFLLVESSRHSLVTFIRLAYRRYLASKEFNYRISTVNWSDNILAELSQLHVLCIKTRITFLTSQIERFASGLRIAILSTKLHKQERYLSFVIAEETAKDATTDDWSVTVKLVYIYNIPVGSKPPGASSRSAYYS
jgi:uncharacterized small protein (DUF1192 family)